MFWRILHRLGSKYDCIMVLSFYIFVILLILWLALNEWMFWRVFYLHNSIFMLIWYRSYYVIYVVILCWLFQSLYNNLHVLCKRVFHLLMPLFFSHSTTCYDVGPVLLVAISKHSMLPIILCDKHLIISQRSGVHNLSTHLIADQKLCLYFLLRLIFNVFTRTPRLLFLSYMPT